MKYPKTVQAKVDFLKQYRETPELNEFNIIHLYPKGLAYPDGFYDSRFFDCVGFNTDTMQKRDLGQHDGLDFWDECIISRAQVFADGAFLIKLDHMVETVGITQMLSLKPCAF